MLSLYMCSAVLGYIGHQFRDWIDRRFGNGYSQLVCYGVGVLLAFPISLHLFKKLGKKEDSDRFTSAFFGGFGPLGLGVLIGWIFDKEEAK